MPEQQTNKVKYIIDKAVLIHSVDSIHLAETIEKFDKMNLNHGELNYKKFWPVI